MKRKILSIISLILSLIMIVSDCTSCNFFGLFGDETSSESGSESGSQSESESNSESSNPGGDKNEPLISGDDADIIELSNKLSNGVSPYYSDSSRNELIISNTQMDLGYNMTPANDMLVSHLSTKDGHDYIKNTMDVYVKMKSGETYYASKAANTQNVLLNIYRYGYYYYENRLEGLSFINSQGKLNVKEIDIKPNAQASHSIETVKRLSNGHVYKITGNDPYIVLQGINFSANSYDTLEITIKVGKTVSASEMYIIAGSQTGFGSKQCETIGIIDDGEAHTYTIPLTAFSDYTGSVKGLRLDINGMTGSNVEITDLKVYKKDPGNSPLDLALQRSFVTYSDKMHHVLQVSAYKETTDIQTFGMLTKIDADTVEKFVVKDRGGLHYDTLSGIAWNTVEYIGFDIKDAGIFGYILPYDGSGGAIKVTLQDGQYIIEQNKAPDGGKVSPSCDYKGTGVSALERFPVIAANNGNDFFMGQRIYTDTYHTFDKFLIEAECERHPLTAENVSVNAEKSDSATFDGYDPLYGYYKFSLQGTSFNPAFYKHPNKQYAVNFTITGDQYDRQIYVMTRTSTGCLESAVLLNNKEMVLPVPMEVAKNFANDGENTIYNNEDRAYGETYFPMIVNSGQTRQYTVVNLYQNWGNFPLKQISSIQYHTPYYHLSTGVTETNCIVPFNVCGPSLPDHRSMSAPHWASQPQHTSGGGHSFLSYTDSTGTYVDSSTTGVAIDSYGPTYCDIALDWITADGKIKATYTHTEMPQTDENRAYYELSYTVLDDVSINDFRNNFTFYYCTDNSDTGTYQKIGYLDVNNEYQVVDVAASGQKNMYILGDECPYFSFFMMPNWDRNAPHFEGYVNLAFLIHSSKIIIKGQEVDPNFCIRNTGSGIRLSLDLGNVELKKGDTFTINAIIMPWGSQELEDDPANRYNKSHTNGYTDYTYSTVLPDGTLYMDKNARDARENSLLNPFRATADKDCVVLDSVFVPKIQSTNGKTAEFTLQGGNSNCAVRIYGFDKLTVPQIEIFNEETGEWEEYVVSSFNTPDMFGYGYYYDGYMVYYDGDGTYSYSFVTEMVNGAPKKFRIAVDEDFAGWPELPPKDDSTIPDAGFNVFYDPKEILDLTISHKVISSAMLAPKNEYVSICGNAGSRDTYMYFFKNDAENPIATGKYLVYKYKVSSDQETFSAFEFFSSTSETLAVGPDQFEVSIKQDDQWHVVIIDLEDKLTGSYDGGVKIFEADDDGNYYAMFLRWDVFNFKLQSSDSTLDIAYIGIHDSLEEIYAYEAGNSDTVLLIDGGKELTIDPSTGNEIVPVYIDPENEQGYTISNVPYATKIDSINKGGSGFNMHNDKQVVNIANPTVRTMMKGELVLTGWMVAEGGVDKYVWSADGGKTWHDAGMYNNSVLTDANDAMIEGFGFYKKYVDPVTGETITPEVIDKISSKKNGAFQGSGGICANLADYYEKGTVVNVTFAAVPAADPTTLCIIGHITDVTVYVAPELEPSETINVPITPESMDTLFKKNSKLLYNISGYELASDNSYITFKGIAEKSDGYATIMSANAQHSGQYLYIKYRIPTGYSSLTNFEIFTSTVNGNPTSGDNFVVSLTQDGKWHVVIVDVSKKLSYKTFNTNDEGRYIAKYLRVDLFNMAPADGMYVDISAIGFADNLNVIYEDICADMDYVTVVGSSSSKVDPATGETYVKTYVHPESGYTISDVEYASWIDYINGKSGSGGAHNDKNVTEKACPNGTTVTDTNIVYISGWAIADGGIEKYVWSADGGKTWNDVILYNMSALSNAGSNHFNSYKDIKKYTDAATGETISPTVADKEASKVNSVFASDSKGIAADLSDFAGQTVDVTFAAVPKADTQSLCLLVQVTGVKVPAAE